MIIAVANNFPNPLPNQTKKISFAPSPPLPVPPPRTGIPALPSTYRIDIFLAKSSVIMSNHHPCTRSTSPHRCFTFFSPHWCASPSTIKTDILALPRHHFHYPVLAPPSPWPHPRTTFLVVPSLHPHLHGYILMLPSPSQHPIPELPPLHTDHGAHLLLLLISIRDGKVNFFYLKYVN